MSDTFSPDDVKFMQLALELAAKGQYTTTPNPSVSLMQNEWRWRRPVRKRKAQLLM